MGEIKSVIRGGAHSIDLETEALEVDSVALVDERLTVVLDSHTVSLSKSSGQEGLVDIEFEAAHVNVGVERVSTSQRIIVCRESVRVDILVEEDLVRNLTLGLGGVG